jgi:pimeloyl-ACP methyl ester carboxylesterase
LLVDLVQTVTRDGIRLDGIFQAPAAKPSAFAVDAFCLLHGTGGNFYSSSLFDYLADRILALGYGVLRVNTRGHDGISTAISAQGGRRQGAAYEVVDDCRHDLAAWIDWLRQRTGPRIVLIGHSLGAVKAIYALAREPKQSVVALIALSPPHLSYARFCASSEAPEFLQTFARAERLVEAEQPGALIEVQLPLPFVVTAAGYLEKYGPEERYDFLPLLPSVPCPTLVTLGELEVRNNMAFRELPEAVAEVAQRHLRIAGATIAGADHFYTAVRRQLADRVESWLRSTLPRQ